MADHLSGSETRADPSVGLTSKQLKFVEAYLLEPNGKQAAIRAGYAPNSAEVTASRLLRHPGVSALIAKEQAKVASRAGVDAGWVLRKLRRIVLRHEKENPGPAVKALELLGKHQKMWTEKVEASGPGGGALEIVISDLGAKPPDEEQTDGEPEVS